MLANILIAIAAIMVVLVGAILIYAAVKPDAFRIERSAEINSPPERVFGLINDFRNWGFWSPWEKLDPDLKRTHSGAASGVGAVYAWEGNKKVGSGRMEIVESAPSKIVIKLDFLKPFEAHNTAEFTLEGRGGSTNVTWAMIGRQPFMFRVMTVFFSMDKLVGRDFEAGLANMRSIAEK